jgi:hypothetical protein
VPEIAPVAECFAAVFTGVTAFLIWRGMQPAKPEIGTELLGQMKDRPRQIEVEIRNPDQRYTLTVEDVKSRRRDTPIEADRQTAQNGKLIGPGSRALLLFYCRSPEPPDELLCKLRIAHHRAKRYTVKVSPRPA